MAGLLLYLACSGHNGGCHPDEGEPLPTPVHAVGAILAHPAGVTVELTLMSDGVAPHDYVAAHAVMLHRPGGKALPLAALASGRYALAAADGRALSSVEGDYFLAFSISDEEAKRAHVFAGDFVLSMHLTPHNAELALVGEAPTEVQWLPQEQQALVQHFGKDNALIGGNHPANAVEAEIPRWAGLAGGGSAQLANLGVGPMVAGDSLMACVVTTTRAPAAVQPEYQTQHNSPPSAGLSSRSGMLGGWCERWLLGEG